MRYRYRIVQAKYYKDDSDRSCLLINLDRPSLVYALCRNSVQLVNTSQLLISNDNGFPVENNKLLNPQYHYDFSAVDFSEFHLVGKLDFVLSQQLQYDVNLSWFITVLEFID